MKNTPVKAQRLSQAAFALLAVLVLTFALSGLLQNSKDNPFLSDFRAFYCAGRAAAQGHDPYLQEPLYSCEAQKTATYLWRAGDHIATPAPVPPYVLPIFVLLSVLPYGLAAALWTMTEVGAFLATLIALRSITSAPVLLLIACLLPMTLISLPLGQLAPISIACACVAAMCLRKGWIIGGSIALGASFMEPHIAGPACAAVFFALPRARLPLGVAAIVLSLAAASFGVGRNVEYFSAVIPAQAASEVAHIGQFSLTFLAHVAGVGDNVALLAGSIQYAIACVLGIAAGYFLSKVRRDIGFAISVPLAFAVLGGSYVHLQQVSAALPAALMLFSRHATFAKALTLVLLAIPWLFVVAWGFLIPLAAVAAGAIAWHYPGKRLAHAIGASAASFIFTLILNRVPAGPIGVKAAAIIAPASSLAQHSWSQYVVNLIAVQPGGLLWAHIPSWIGLTVAAGTIVTLCGQELRRRVTISLPLTTDNAGLTP